MSARRTKTSELTGAALDWAVAKCEGLIAEHGLSELQVFYGIRAAGGYRYSSDWAQGGPIIDRERLCAGYRHQPDPDYCKTLPKETICWARTTSGGYLSYGPTLLVAAMRCYVAGMMGDEIDVPEELL